MALQNGESVWKLTLGILVLFVFLGIGIAHIVDPDRFIRKSGVRKGGEMLTEVNQFGFQMVGAVFVFFSAYGIYELLRKLFGG